MSTVIWWIRRDLRVTDNDALTAAVAYGQWVIPCYVIDPRLMDSSGASEARRSFLLAGLAALDGALRRRGSRLIVRRGEPEVELARLREESGASAIFAEADFSPYARRRDARLAQHLPLRLVGAPSVRHPSSVLKSDGAPYTVFTPFKRAWLAQPLPSRAEVLAAPEQIRTPSHLASLPLPKASPVPSFPAGEVEARGRLERFLAGPIARYAETRNRLDLPGTSQLSPYLRFGMLSARQAVVAALEVLHRDNSRGAELWLSELIWREFYTSILYHFPWVLTRSFQARYDRIAWRNQREEFTAWQAGGTGYPVVDAAMRQLSATGWMHNRARMIVASFLVKDLLVDWRWGERWFMNHLVDGDPAANNGGWQWTAGVGTDAAPYFRIFNPVLQSKKFDPDGGFIRTWIPELADVPKEYIHAPWQMPLAMQEKSGCRIGRDYPGPIVDHSVACRRALLAYEQERANPT